MKVEIVSPEQKLLECEAEAVSLPGINGKFTVLNNHAPIISLLVEGEIKVKGQNIRLDEEVENKFSRTKEGVILPVKGGAMEMKNNRIIILVD